MRDSIKRKINKVLLITPPAFTSKRLRDINPVPPLGLGYLAAVLEQKGIEVRLFDSLIEGIGKEEPINDEEIRIGATFEDIEKEIRSFSPDIVGVSNLFSKQAKNAHRIHELVKRIDSNILVIAGGAHPSVMPELVMEDGNVDFIVIGEGERTIDHLIDHLEGKKSIEELDGIAFRDNGSIKVIEKKNFIADLDSLPFPARHLMHMEKYFGLPASHGTRHSKRFSPIVTSRGCPAGCTFCTAHHVWGKPFRRRSAENVVREMKEIKDKYGIEELLIEDDNLTLDVQRAEEIFDLMIEEKLNFKWDTPNGVAAFALNEKLLEKMKKAGCYQLNIAVESGNKDVLKSIIKKPLDLDRIKPLVKYSKDIGLGVNIFIIIGMPGESLKQMWDSYLFARDLGIYNPFVSIATPYPGSELYNLCREKGYISENFSLDKLYITSSSISTDEWSGEDVKELFNKGYNYLKLLSYKKHPLSFLIKVIEKTFKDPRGSLKKVGLLCQAIKN